MIQPMLSLPTVRNACDVHFHQGGVIDHISWVPNPIPLSTAESENNCYSAAVMRASYVTKILCKLWYDNADASYTVPICVDSSAAKAMNESDCPSRKTRHVESRCWFGKLARQQGRVRCVKVDGDTQQPADIGAKNVLWDKTNHHLPMIEAAKSLDEQTCACFQKSPRKRDLFCAQCLAN